MRKIRMVAGLHITLLLFALLGCGSVETNQEIIEIYKKLDAQDFASQQIPDNEEEADKILKKIYVEPALSNFQEALQLMRENDIRRVHHETSYKTVKLVEKKDDQVILRVDSLHDGDEYTISSPQKHLGTYSIDFKAEVTMKKVKDTWFISEIKPASLN